MYTGYRDVVLRSWPARILTVLVVAACVAAEAGFVLSGDPDAAARAVAPLALVAIGSWTLFWRPSLRIDPSAVVMVNPLRTVTVTWPAITDVHGRWGLELETAEHRYTAWAAPRGGSIAAGRATRAVMRQRRAGSEARPDGRALDLAAAASEVVLHRWSEYRDAGLLGAPEDTGIGVVWHPWTCGALVLCAVATIAGALIP